MKLGLILAFACLAPAVAAEEVNLYTDRQETLLRPVLNAFEQESGVKVNVLFAKKGLLERLRAEGRSSPADAVLVIDIGRLQDFAGEDLLAPYDDEALREAVPADWRTSHWLSVTRRARVLFVPSSDAKIRRYEDLADTSGVCLRSGKHPYNIGLFSDRIVRQGEAAAKEWLLAVKENLARRPSGNDRAQIRGVLNGECAVAVANAYYYFKMLGDESVRDELKAKVKMVVPDDAHINVTGIGLTKHAPNRENALALMRFLTSVEGQEIFIAENGEYPVRGDVDLPSAWAVFAPALTATPSWADIARHRSTASRLIDEIGFDR